MRVLPRCEWNCTHSIRIPPRVALVAVQLSERCGGGKHGAPGILVISPGSARASGAVSPITVRRNSFDGVVPMVWSQGWRDMGPLGWRRADHEQEALLGRRQLGNVVLRVCPTDMLLHGAVSLLLECLCPVSFTTP